MRNLRKTLKVRDLKIKYYDPSDKLEKLLETTVSEVENEVELPRGCVKLSEQVLSEREVVFRMTPQTFVKHATIIEK